jgi:hypothetical protein
MLSQPTKRERGVPKMAPPALVSAGLRRQFAATPWLIA